MANLYTTEASSQPEQQAWLEALAHISRHVAGGHGEGIVAQETVTAIAKITTADVCLIALREADGEHVVVIAQAGQYVDMVSSLAGLRAHYMRFPIAKRIYKNGETIALDDSTQDPDMANSPEVQQLGSRSFFAAPLIQGSNVLGALGVHFTRQTHHWSDIEAEWLKALADQCALAVTVERTTQTQQRDIAVREALHTASQRLQAAADLDTVIQATMEGVGQVVPCVGVSVHLLNDVCTEATIAGLLGFGQNAGDLSKVRGFKYRADDGGLNTRTLLEHEAFFLRDFQVEADRWANSDAPTLRAWMSVPLMSQGRCFGKITVDHDLPNVYGPEELAIVQTFAAHAASAIERAYLYAEATSRADQLAALHQISQELVAARDEASLYESLRKRVMQAFTGETFLVCLAHSATEQMEVPVLIDGDRDYAPLTWEPKPGPVMEVLRTGRAVQIKGRKDWDRYGFELVGNESQLTEAAMFAPLIWNEMTLGIISLQTYQDRAYTCEEFQTFQALASTAALALGRIRSEAATAERAAQFAALAQSARALVSNLELSDVLQSVVDRARDLTSGEAFLMLYNPEDNVISVRTFAGESAWHQAMHKTATLRPGEGVGGISFAEQRTIVVQDMLFDDRALYRGESPMRSLVVLPLTVGDNKMGILELAWSEPNAVTQDRLALCMAFADHAALAIHNARQHDQLRQREAERTALLRQVLTAQEAERKRVALDLHDGPLQSLGVGLIHADTLRKRAETGGVSAKDIHALRLDFAAVVNEVRDLMADLHPEVLDAYGLRPALEAHARRVGETTHLAIQIECNLDERLPAYMEVLIYRLVQECLSNVRKHAQATNAWITLHLDNTNQNVTVKVADDGRGFNPRQMPVRSGGFGLGLSSMAERAASASGKMTIESVPGQSTTITFHLPLPQDGPTG